jgi:shikimate kinase
MPLHAVFLIGFMGSGKTTLGKKLAAKLNWKFIDLDEAVRVEHGAESVAALIKDKGFDFFRQAEGEMLKSLSLENVVVSTGGGTPCYFDNLEWMKGSGVVVFLDVDEGMLYSRLVKELDLQTTDDGRRTTDDDEKNKTKNISGEDSEFRIQNSEFKIPNRPLLEGLDEDGLKEFIRKTLQERMPFYGQADIVFRPSDERIEGLVREIRRFGEIS